MPKKRKAMPAYEAEAALGKGKAMKKSRPAAQAVEKTSAMEKVLAKLLKTSKKLLLKETQSRSSGLSIVEKASAASTRFVTVTPYPLRAWRSLLVAAL